MQVCELAQTHMVKHMVFDCAEEPFILWTA
jgi:hypothetical protein